MKKTERLEVFIMKKDLLRKLFMVPNEDPYFAGDKAFRFKEPICQIVKTITKDRPATKSVTERYEDFSEG